MSNERKFSLSDYPNVKIYISLIVIGLGAFLLAYLFPFTFPLKKDAFKLDEVMHILGPAIIAALLVERAVEVIVMAWRKFGRMVIENEIKVIGENLPNLNDEEKANAEIDLTKKIQELFKYKNDTLQRAAAFSLFFSFLIALVGVRVLIPFFDIDADLLNCMTGLENEPEECPSGIDDVAKTHYAALVRLDVFIATFVIAGGSAGLHSIVSAITNFADKTKDNMNTTPPSAGKTTQNG